MPIMFLTAGTLPLFGTIAERHPQLTLIIDHMGISSQVVAQKKVPEAVDAAAALAKYPNVSIKLSAAPAYSSEPYPFSDMNGHIKRLFDAYGPQRSYWGSDVTQGFAKASYKERIAHFLQELKFLSEERQGLGDGTRDPCAAELEIVEGADLQVRVQAFAD